MCKGIADEVPRVHWASRRPKFRMTRMKRSSSWFRRRWQRGTLVPSSRLRSRCCGCSYGTWGVFQGFANRGQGNTHKFCRRTLGRGPPSQDTRGFSKVSLSWSLPPYPCSRIGPGATCAPICSGTHIPMPRTHDMIPIFSDGVLGLNHLTQTGTMDCACILDMGFVYGVHWVSRGTWKRL